MEFKRLAKLAFDLGNDPLQVQGAGGNVSLKEDGLIYVKSSGTWMKDALDKNVFVALPLEKAKDAASKGKLNEVEFQSFGSQDKRPSIETSLHVLMPHNVVAHVHCVDAISVSVRSSALSILNQVFDGLKWAFVPYVKPGEDLYSAVKSILVEKQKVDVIVLGNHGLVVGGKTCQEVKALLEDVRGRLRQPSLLEDLGSDIGCDLSELDYPGYKLPKYSVAHMLAYSDHLTEVVTSGSLYPDHVVFLGKSVDIYESGVCKQSGVFSRVKIVPGKGVLLCNSVSLGGEEMLRALVFVASRIPINSTIKYLTSFEEDQLLNWDAEKYRQSIAK